MVKIRKKVEILVASGRSSSRDKSMQRCRRRAVTLNPPTRKMTQRGTTVLVAVLLALLHLGATQHAVIHSVCSSTDGSCGSASGVAQSQTVDQSGVTTGECAYIDKSGQSIKIRYRQTPNGQIEASANHDSVTDPVAELAKCRKASKVVSENVQQTLRQTQEQIFRQQQELQDQIFRQQQEIQNQLFNPRNSFPSFFAFPNVFPFNNFRQG
ncbi:uncharacterized protein [Procambarus clarkii]|uniref:uncharacterized protein n=1 Tax=Procambarus clarkii TaxID=6728 RepID=UPI001E671DF1|nr:uncharacterized protein LOC123773638 [Procambarus clarkii]